MFTCKRTVTPTVFQFGLTECGPACLKIILAYWGRWVSLEELRESSGAARDGTRAANLLKAARTYGLDAEGYRRELDELSSIPMTCIFDWGFNHFVVLERISKRYANINDPERGRRRVPIHEMDKHFTGIVLSFKPSADFVRRGSAPNLVASLLTWMQTSRAGLAHIALATVLLMLPSIAVPAIMRLFIDAYMMRRGSDWGMALAAAFGVAIVLQSSLMWTLQRSLLRLEIHILSSRSIDLFWRIIHMPLNFFLQRTPSDLVGRIDANQRVAQLIAGSLIPTVIRVITMATFAIVMLTYDTILTLVVLLCGCCMLLLVLFTWRPIQRLTRRSVQNQGRVTAFALNGLTGFESLKANGGESTFFNVWAGHHSESVAIEQALGISSLLLNSGTMWLLGLGNAAVLLVGAYRVMAGELTIGSLVAFQALIVGFVSPIREFTQLGVDLHQASADLRRLDDLSIVPCELPQEHVSVPAKRSDATPIRSVGPKRLTGEIIFSHAGFSYARWSPPIVNDFCLRVRAGQRVAIVGTSGSGKSTIAKLGAGLLAPTEGTILYDGLAIQAISRRTFVNSVAFVDQDDHLLAGTIRENISLWDSALSDETVVMAARDAHFSECVDIRSGSFEALVSERGKNLSGGERQRLEIARALAQEPSILIMDEATSALDPIAESIINDNLKRRSCTCLIIAHRLSTVRDCDQIVVLAAGEIVEQGTHDSLIAKGGEYVRLLREV